MLLEPRRTLEFIDLPGYKPSFLQNQNQNQKWNCPYSIAHFLLILWPWIIPFQKAYLHIFRDRNV